MTKAKQTLDQYNQTREEGTEKLQALFDEKNNKRAAIKELFGDNSEEFKSQSKTMRVNLNAKWKEQNTDLIAKYQELYQQKKLDDEAFQRGLEEFRKGNPDIDEQVLWNLFIGKGEKKDSSSTKESKEITKDNIDYLDTPIQDIDFSTRTSNCIKAADITTLRELLEIYKSTKIRRSKLIGGLSNIRNFGKTSFLEIKDFLEQKKENENVNLEEDLLMFKAKKQSKLLNKPNMTEKDKKGMQAAIDYLAVNHQDTITKIKMLDNIIYTPEYINIGGVKRARKDISAKQNSENIFQHNGVTYFKPSKEMIDEQNNILAQQGMGIPVYNDCIASLRYLPRIDRRDSSEDILAFILDIGMDGYCDSNGKLNLNGVYGYRLLDTPKEGKDLVYSGLKFSRSESDISSLEIRYAYPIRPIFK